MRHAPAFFEYAKLRYNIFRRREMGRPEPWTSDPILGRYRFCNVFREDDRTTRWFRTHVRDDHRLAGRPELLLATVVFRMFNRISTGEAVFCQTDIEGTPFELFAEDGNVGHLKKAILAGCGKRGPYVTGSYIISTPPGFPKLDGVLQVIKMFWKDANVFGRHMETGLGWKSVGLILAQNRQMYGLEEVWDWLRQFDYLGKFHSYEIVTDLRHTSLLGRAPDIMTWANPGPGARRGLCRVHGMDLDERIPREQQIKQMRELLVLSQDGRMWSKEWPRWELRDVEHTLCEFDKYERARTGQGRPRGVFR